MYLSSFSKTLAPGLPRRLDRCAGADRRASWKWRSRPEDLCTRRARSANGVRGVPPRRPGAPAAAAAPPLPAEARRDGARRCARQLGDDVHVAATARRILPLGDAAAGDRRRAAAAARVEHGVIYVAGTRSSSTAAAGSLMRLSFSAPPPGADSRGRRASGAARFARQPRRRQRRQERRRHAGQHRSRDCAAIGVPAAARTSDAIHAARAASDPDGRRHGHPAARDSAAPRRPPNALSGGRARRGETPAAPLDMPGTTTTASKDNRSSTRAVRARLACQRSVPLRRRTRAPCCPSS